MLIIYKYFDFAYILAYTTLYCHEHCNGARLVGVRPLCYNIIYIWALIVCYYEIDCMFTEHPDKLIVLSAESDVLTSQNQLSQTGRLTLQGLCR